MNPRLLALAMKAGPVSRKAAMTKRLSKIANVVTAGEPADTFSYDGGLSSLSRAVSYCLGMGVDFAQIAFGRVATSQFAHIEKESIGTAKPRRKVQQARYLEKWRTVREIDGPTTIMLTIRKAKKDRNTNGLLPIADSGITTKVMNKCTATPNAKPLTSA
jgi:hypothetical protein